VILSLSVWLVGAAATAQSVRPLPYDERLMTDANLGNVEGLQRFGRQQRTDPEFGVGYNYQVMPLQVVDPALFPSAGRLRFDSARIDPAQIKWQEVGQLANQYHAASLKLKEDQNDVTARASRDNAWKQLQMMLYGRIVSETPETGVDADFDVEVDVAAAAEFAAGLGTVALGPSQFAAASGLRESPLGIVQPFAPVFDAKLALKDKTLEVFHQPLIQVKVRVVEVVRNDNLAAASILDYIGAVDTGNSLFSGGNINDNGRKVSGVTRFAAPIGVVPTLQNGNRTNVSGNGQFVNMTTRHINWLASLLATEFQADVITAPEVATLNGQNVEFVSGEKMPFATGITVIEGHSSTTQAFFYKSVGTYISVTPRIVNWGRHAEMQGAAPLQATEIQNWNLLFEWMIDEHNLRLMTPEEIAALEDNSAKKFLVTRGELLPYVGNMRPAPFEIRKKALWTLSGYPGDELRRRLWAASLPATPANAHSSQQDSDIQLLRLPPIESDCATAAVFVQPESEGPAAQTPPLPTPTLPEAPQSKLPGAPEVIDPGEEIGESPEAREPILRIPSGQRCDWRPEECVIDLEIIVRLSDFAADQAGIGIDLQRGSDPDETVTVPAGVEDNVRSVANVLQVKSGHGVVMAGLIGESDVESIDKIPVLGDVPLAGYLFRSKLTERQKTETLIFVEASVLPPSWLSAAESTRDFGLSQPHVQTDLGTDPLGYASYRAGQGPYLPPRSPQEGVYWERLGRKVRKASTELDDIFE
jgi:hypothetical protein